MKIDKTTYKDRKETQIGMTADLTSQPDKVLFFADPHFLFFNFMAAAHLVLPKTQANPLQNQKSQISLALNSSQYYILR